MSTVIMAAPKGLHARSALVRRSRYTYLIIWIFWRAEADETENYTYAIALQNDN
ncbi:MAG: hypothetical protein ACOY3N_07710 [Bradyrhizobium sp.]|uniref:hypothetical protein n=1 Tax=Bradyrhizobium sp. TaxID=376 RepID=UPI003BF385A2